MRATANRLGENFFWRKAVAKLMMPWWEVRARAIARDLAPHLSHSKRVLDIGAGNGLIAQELTRIIPGLECKLVDVIDWNLSCLPLTLFDGKRIPFPDNAFDAALLVDVIHHTDNDEVFLDEALRVSGQLFVIEDAHENSFKRFALSVSDNLQWVLYGMPIGRPTRDLQDLNRLFVQRGVKVMPAGKIWHHPLFVLTKTNTPG